MALADPERCHWQASCPALLIPVVAQGARVGGLRFARKGRRSGMRESTGGYCHEVQRLTAGWRESLARAVQT